ncbi:hypothetical protein [Quadrisphaera sp. DSM 44207]|nr:hypothetical protein [Quadrisphaera sp. DSM 44207]
MRAGTTLDDVHLLVATMPTDRCVDVRRRWAELVLPGVLQR